VEAYEFIEGMGAFNSEILIVILFNQGARDLGMIE